MLSGENFHFEKSVLPANYLNKSSRMRCLFAYEIFRKGVSDMELQQRGLFV
jgi:hypothetical protein